MNSLYHILNPDLLLRYSVLQLILIIAKLSDHNQSDPGNPVLLLPHVLDLQPELPLLLLLKHYILLQINTSRMFLIPMKDFHMRTTRNSGLLSYLLTFLNPQLLMTLCPLLTHVLAVQEIVDLNLNFQHIQKHFSYFLQIFMYDISLLSCLRIAKLRLAYVFAPCLCAPCFSLLA